MSAELIKVGKVVPDERSVVGRVGFGLAAHAYAPAPDIATTEAFKPDEALDDPVALGLADVGGRARDTEPLHLVDPS